MAGWVSVCDKAATLAGCQWSCLLTVASGAAAAGVASDKPPCGRLPPQCYATYFAAHPDSAAHTHMLNPRSAVKLGAKLLGMVCKDDDDMMVRAPAAPAVPLSSRVSCTLLHLCSPAALCSPAILLSITATRY